MSDSPHDRLTRQLRRLHRRLVVVRLVEHAGLGLFGACALVALLIPVLLWRGQPAWGLVAWAAGGGVMVGIVWGLRRLPTRLDAAVEADRQLGLADLLGTALALCQALGKRPATWDPWAAAVLASAEAQSRSLRASAVAVSRLGVRAWGGIGLAAALVLALASLSTYPADVRAGEDQSAARRNSTPTAPGQRIDDPPLVAAPWQSPARHPPAPAEQAGDGRERPSAPKADRSPTEARERDGGANQTPRTTDSGSDANHAQGGLARNDAATGQPRSHGDRQPTGDGQADRAPGAHAGGGGVQATSDVPRLPGLSSVTGGGLDLSRETPPWGSDTWPADTERARRALDAGQVPDRYRDFVRRYFERTP